MIRSFSFFAVVLFSALNSMGNAQEVGSSSEELVLRKQPSLALPQFKENTPPDRFEYLAIEDAIAGYLDAINRRDARRAASFWSRRGEWRRKDGERVSGRERIERAIEESFEGEPRGTTITLNEVSIRLITPNVALEEGLAVVSSPESQRETSYSVVHVKMDDGWKIDSVRATRAPVASPRKSGLETLGWLIGDWRDDVAGGISVETKARWTEGDHSIRRSFQMFDENGLREQATQVIVWDAKIGTIRSWIFDSKGGFGTGIWEQIAENTWAVETEFQLADGGVATATNVYKVVDNSRLEFFSTSRKLNGVDLPDTEPVSVNRK